MKKTMRSTKGRIVVVLIVFICLFASISIGERAAWDCPACGRKGNTGKYCGSCGYATWDCPECGRKGNTGRFCGSCGHPAPKAAPRPRPARRRGSFPRGNRRPSWILRRQPFLPRVLRARGHPTEAFPRVREEPVRSSREFTACFGADIRLSLYTE